MTDKPPDKPDPAPQADVPGEPPAALPVLSYATPSAYDLGVWRSGSYVVVSSGADLPDRCVKCNCEASVRIPLRIGGQWALQIALRPRWRAQLIRKRTAPLHVGLCWRHVIEWRTVRIIMGLVFTALGAVLFLSEYASKGHNFDPANPKDWLGAIFIWTCDLATVCYFYFQKPVAILRRDGHGIWLRFTGRRFRNSLRPLEVPKVGFPIWPPGNSPPSGEI
jgi:hypothetical protein